MDHTPQLMRYKWWPAQYQKQSHTGHNTAATPSTSVCHQCLKQDLNPIKLFNGYCSSLDPNVHWMCWNINIGQWACYRLNKKSLYYIVCRTRERIGSRNSVVWRWRVSNCSTFAKCGSNILSSQEGSYSILIISIFVNARFWNSQHEYSSECHLVACGRHHFMIHTLSEQILSLIVLVFLARFLCFIW